MPMTRATHAFLRFVVLDADGGGGIDRDDDDDDDDGGGILAVLLNRVFYIHSDFPHQKHTIHDAFPLLSSFPAGRIALSA